MRLILIYSLFSIIAFDSPAVDLCLNFTDDAQVLHDAGVGTYIAGGAIKYKGKAMGVDDVRKKRCGFLTSPLTRMAVSGVMGVIVSKIKRDYSKHLKESKAKELELLRLKKELEGIFGVSSCSSKDRNNASKPACYCRGTDGKLNGSRQSLDVCMAYLGQGKLAANANTYEGNYSDEVNSGEGCLRQGGIFDKNCQCKKNNSCYKLPNLKLNGVGSNIASLAKSNVSRTNKLFRGEIPAITNSQAALHASAAAKIKKATDKIIQKKDPQLFANLNKIKDRLGNQMLNETKRVANKINPKFLENTQNNPNQLAASSKLKKINSKLNDKIRKINTSLASTSVAPSSKRNQNSFDLDFGGRSNARGGVAVFDIAKKEFDLTNMGIEKNSNRSIFDMISVKYLQTAPDRLFKEEN